MHRNQPTTEKPEANNSRITGPEEPQKAQDPTKELAQKREEPKQRKHQNTQLLSWCFEPSQPQKITSGLNTYFTLSPSYSFHKSSHHNAQVMFFWAYFYSTGAQHRNLHPAEWPNLFCRPTQEPLLATANAGKNWERFWKKCRWMDWEGRNKEELPGSKCNMYGYILTYSRL